MGIALLMEFYAFLQTGLKPWEQPKHFALAIIYPVMKNSFLIFLVLCLACNPDKDKTIDPAKVNYNTSDASELFFKNVRMSRYEKQSLQGTKMEIFKHRDVQQNDILVASLAINWLYNQAYLLIDSLPQPQTTFIFGNENLEANFINKKEALKNSIILYNQVIQGNELFYLNEGDTLPLFNNDQSRETFRVTMVDFLRMTDSY